MSEKTRNSFGKNHNNFYWETLCEFLDNSPKISRLVRKLRYNVFFTNPWKSISLKIFVKISLNFWKTFVTVGQGYDKLFTNEVSLYSTRIYKSLLFSTALASSGCVKDLRLVNHLVWLSNLVSKQLLLNNKFYALLDQL